MMATQPYNSPQYQQAAMNTALNFTGSAPAAIAGGILKKVAPRVIPNAVSTVARQIHFHPEDIQVMKNFAATVDRLGSKANRINFGQLGKDAQNVVEHYFGKKFVALSNT